MHDRERRPSPFPRLPLTLLTSLALASGITPRAFAQTSPDQSWPDLTRRDLVAIHDTLAANAAFTATKRDSAGMRSWLRRGLTTASRLAGRARNERDYRLVLGTYVSGFKDPHLGVTPGAIQVFQRPLDWPGVSLRLRNGRYEVAYVAKEVRNTAPPLGAILENCDRMPPSRLRRERLSRWINLRDDVTRLRADPLLLWNPSSLVTPITQCRFQSGSYKMTWRLPKLAVDSPSTESARSAPAFLPVAQFGLARWGDGWWIGLPNMINAEEWASLHENVDRRLSALRAAQLVVLDLRGNRGGDSRHGERLLQLLWPRAAGAQPHADPVVMRTGPLVRSWLEHHNPSLLPAYDRARSSDAPTITVGSRSAPLRSKRRSGPRGRIYVLTDWGCISSCLQFVDEVLSLPNALQVGWETSSDTIFGEVAEVTLPSKMSRLFFPIKAWVTRRRASHQRITPSPALRWRGEPTDEAALYAWLWTISR